jgi:hypothetical protein
MNQSKWYMVTPECGHGMQDLKDTYGVYLAGRILPVGSIIPLGWKGQQKIRDLYLPVNYLMDYDVQEEDWAILYALWPAMRPNDFTMPIVDNYRIQQNGEWVGAWYKIASPDEKRNMSSVPYAYAALADVEGVCKAGDLAFSGDIVPAAFFAGLDTNQFDRLLEIGLCSDSWLNTWPRQYRSGYLRELSRPVMEQVGVPKDEREMLYQKFPALRPQDKTAVPTNAITRKRKA